MSIKIKGKKFQSTRPVRGATYDAGVAAYADWFQSTRPVRGATLIGMSLLDELSFQSTRPVRGATTAHHRSPALHPTFQSTRPVRGATDVLNLELLIT